MNANPCENGGEVAYVVLLMRASGFVLAVVGVFGLKASVQFDAAGKRPLELVPIFILLLAAAGVLLVRAQRVAAERKKPPSI
jgi:hypothetical protein